MNRSPSVPYGLAIVAAALLSWAFVATVILPLPKPAAAEPTATHLSVSVLVDELTGCHYLHKDGAMTPRIDATGLPMCEPVERRSTERTR